MNSLPTIWSGSEEISIPKNASDVSEIVPLANGLTVKQKNHLINAFNTLEAYDMAVEYSWKKTITRLKEALSSLGMQFIGEMLGRNDITDNTPYENVLTDYHAIQLAEQLGLFTPTAGLQLRQAHELITHYFSSDAKEEIDKLTALNIIKNTVKYVLGHEQMEVAIEFTNFRNRLLTENLKPGDSQLEMLINSPLFYSRTVSFILLNSIVKDEGAKIEHGLANFNLILPLIWEKLSDNDKYNVGYAYRDVISSNNNTAANGLKQALSKVGGFDFVPESLRSNTFIKAAKYVVEVHYAMNNFYNEPAAVETLANLGSTIPKPAFLQCMQAYLVVCIGNIYGTSTIAAHHAKEKLSEVPEDRWKYYFEKGINNDQEVLYNLRSDSQVRRLSNVLNDLNLTKFSNLPNENQKLYNAIIKVQSGKVQEIASELYQKMKK